jgi:hypothetical protein
MIAAPQGSAVLALRYRPLGDVLFAQLDHGGRTDDANPSTHGADEVEYLDADCVVRWASVGGRRVVRSVQIIGSAARIRQGRFPTLPPALTEAARALVERSARLAPDASTSLTATVVLTLDDLSLSGPVGGDEVAGEPAPRAVSRELASALVHLASTIAAEVDTPTAGGDEFDDLTPVLRFVGALHELAGVIAEQRRPAPGLAARAVECVRGGLPLTASERSLLRQALTDIDRSSTWRAVARGIDALSSTIDDHRRLRTEEGP